MIEEVEGDQGNDDTRTVVIATGCADSDSSASWTRVGQRTAPLPSWTA